MAKDFYVYIHQRKSDGLIFYVGKGMGDRKYDKFHRSLWWKNIESKHGRVIVLAQENMSEEDAFLLEMWLIAKFKHEGCPLVNLTTGGEGNSGWRHTNESIRKIKETQVKVVYSSLGECFNGLRSACDYLKESGWPKSDPASISMCCNGKLSSTYGRAWSYDGFPEHPEVMGRELQKQSAAKAKSKPVITSLGEWFPSINESVLFVNREIDQSASYFHIKKALKNQEKEYFGRYWSYPT